MTRDDVELTLAVEAAALEEGHAHIRALLTGSVAMVPFREGRLLLGERQQVVFIDFGTERTERALILQVQGE